VDTVAELGRMPFSTGEGLSIVKGQGADVVLSGLVTVTLTMPASANRFPGTVNWSWFELLKVASRAVPLKLTLAPDTKPWPLTVRGTEVPTNALDGMVLNSSGLANAVATLPRTAAANRTRETRRACMVWFLRNVLFWITGPGGFYCSTNSTRRFL